MNAWEHAVPFQAVSRASSAARSPPVSSAIEASRVGHGAAISRIWTMQKMTPDVPRHFAPLSEMIKSYRDKRTQDFAEGRRVPAFQGLERQGEERLEILDAAISRNDLAALPSNRLEALRGDRKGQYSIAIDRQWRLCFEWPGGSDGPENVEIVDYHRG